MSVDKRLTHEEKKKIKPANQGGGPNYLGKQETVTVPKKWLSDPDHVVAELAYITPREQKILLDANIYGSLKGKPNKGPGGIMSLQGDLGGYSSGPSNGGGNNNGGGGGNNDYKSRDYYNMMTGTGTTATSPTGDTVRSKNIAKGAVPEYVTVNPFTSDQKTQYVGSKYKSTGQPSFFSNLFSKTPGYTGTYGTGTGLFDRKNTITYDPTNQRYQSLDPRVGNLKPGIGGRILGGLASLVTGIPVVGSVLGSMYDYGKGIFGNKPKDMSEFNKLGLHADRFPEGFGVPTQQGDYDVLGNKINEITGEITAPDGTSLGFLEGYTGQKSGITTIPTTEGSDNYTKLIEQYLPVSTMPEDEELSGGFKSRFLQNRTKEEREAIEKMINEKFKYDYNSFGLGDMDGS